MTELDSAKSGFEFYKKRMPKLEWTYRQLLHATLPDFIEGITEVFMPGVHTYLSATMYVDTPIDGYVDSKMCALLEYRTKTGFKGYFALMDSGTWLKVRIESKPTDRYTWNGDDMYYRQYETTYHLVENMNITNELISDMLTAKSISADEMESLAVSIVNDIQDMKL